MFRAVSVLSLLGALLVFGQAMVLQAAPNAEKAADKQVKVKGTFEWNTKKGQRHNLDGTLTPDDAGKWNVIWEFSWGNSPAVYKGVITGDLRDGEISGTGNETKGKRTFSFEGKAKDGVWTVNCFETTGGVKWGQGNALLEVQK